MLTIAVWLRRGTGEGPQAAAVTSAVRSFEAAVAGHDIERLKATTTESFYHDYLQLSGSASIYAEDNPELAIGSPVTRKIEHVTLQGETATVAATIRGTDARNIDAITLRLVKRAGRWLLDGTAMRKTNPGSRTQVIDVVMRDFSFAPDAPYVRPDSEVVFRLQNLGAQPHMAGIWAVPQGANLIKVIEATDAVPEGVERIVQGSTFAVGDEGDITVKGGLRPGRYMLTCFLSDLNSPALTPHYDLGMLTEFEVK
jgi:hypothetical protein